MPSPQTLRAIFVNTSDARPDWFWQWGHGGLLRPDGKANLQTGNTRPVERCRHRVGLQTGFSMEKTDYDSRRRRVVRAPGTFLHLSRTPADGRRNNVLFRLRFRCAFTVPPTRLGVSDALKRVRYTCVWYARNIINEFFSRLRFFPFLFFFCIAKKYREPFFRPIESTAAVHYRRWVNDCVLPDTITVFDGIDPRAQCAQHRGEGGPFF